MKIITSVFLGGILFGIWFFTCGNDTPVQIVNNTSKTELSVAAESEELWTGVAVSHEGRMFVNYPRWSPEVTVSVGEISISGDVIPFPNKNWNTWAPEFDAADHLICVQSVYIDRENFLWILDPANPMFRGVVSGGAKLLKVDLRSNQVTQKIIFDTTVAPFGSYLNDVRVDTERGYAYLTDSGLGAIIVVNLDTGESRRVLNAHTSTKAEDITLTIEGNPWGGKVHSDGLALDLPREYLYYQALTGRSLYRIKTVFLRDTTLVETQLGKRVEFVFQSGASDAIEFGPDGNLYLTSLEYNAIRRFTPEGTVEMVVQDSRLKWPDSFSITPDGMIYFTTSQLHLVNSRAEPYRIFKIEQR